MSSTVSLSGKRGPAVYRAHRVLDELKDQGRSAAWFCRRVPCDRSLLYRTRDGQRGIPEWFALRASEILGKPVRELFFDRVDAESDDAA